MPDKPRKIVHINSQLPTKRHPPMHLIHKFWARKPHNVIKEYIEHYSEEGEIVIDPFCGSGVTAVEALKVGRKAIAIDLDPIATFLTRMTAIPVNLDKFKKSFKRIKDKVKKRIDEFYEIDCPNCSGKANTIHVKWSYVVLCPFCTEEIVMATAKRAPQRRQNIYTCPHCSKEFSYANQRIVEEVPLELRYECDDCQTKGYINNPTVEIDFDLSKVWYPHLEFNYPNGKPFRTKRRANTIEELFTKRNLASLSILREEIENVKDDKIRDLMKVVFSSAIPLASRMMILTKTSGASWKVPEYLIYAVHFEFNVWTRFDNRYKTVYRAKKQSNEEIKNFKEAKNFKDLLEKDANFLAITKSTLELADEVPPNSVDYVFTDPPYGGSIQYYELDMLSASWLRGKEGDERFPTDWWKDEITENSGQEKDFGYYHKMLCRAFEQIYRTLKPERHMTVTFHNIDVKTYTSILQAGILTGFTLQKSLYQSPATVSAKGRLQPYGSAIGDYYIRFFKGKDKTLPTIPEVSKERYERVVVEVARRMIAERGDPTPLTHLLTMYSSPELQKYGAILGAKEKVDDILKKYEGKEFVLVEAKDEKGKVIGKKWWLKHPEKYLLHVIPLSERVEITVMSVLNRGIKVSFDEILRHIYVTFPNTLTPDQPVMPILRKYAERTRDKKWRLRTRVFEREREHDKIVEILADIGKKAGFDVHADLPKWRKDAFPNIPLENVKGVKEIDVVWFTKTNITHEFEVENTTGIWSAIIRGSNIPNGKVKRFIVIPEERQETFYNKINVPALKERVQEENWRFIFYDDLKTFSEKIERKKKVSSEDFEQISQIPNLPKKTVETLELFTNPSHQT